MNDRNQALLTVTIKLTIRLMGILLGVIKLETKMYVINMNTSKRRLLLNRLSCFVVVASVKTITFIRKKTFALTINSQ